MQFQYPIPEHRKKVYSFYQLSFSSDGCPMKTMADGTKVFHPILAAYLIYEYVRWYESSNDRSHLERAISIARLALARAEVVEDALVFYYRPETKLSYIPTTFYSALTQAWYINSLIALRTHVSDIFDAEIRRIFQSLLIPIDQGGCLIKKDWGWIVEEYPKDPPLYTLNGWLTVMKMIAQSRGSLRKVGINANHFLRENLRALKKMLPLYDAGFCFNSRYQLTGFSRVKLIFDKNPEGKFISFEVNIPGEGLYSASMTKGKNRWENYLERDEGRIKQFNVLLSMASYPANNSLRFRYETEKDYIVKAMISRGEYDPLLTGMPHQSWVEVGEYTVSPGSSEIVIQVPWDDQNLFAYPTNFIKKIGDKRFNAYHYIHIEGLAWLYAHTSDDQFREQALKWLSYVDQWPQASLLKIPDISLDPQNYDLVGFKRLLSNIFKKKRSGISLT